MGKEQLESRTNQTEQTQNKITFKDLDEIRKFLHYCATCSRHLGCDTRNRLAIGYYDSRLEYVGLKVRISREDGCFVCSSYIPLNRGMGQAQT